MTGRPLWRCYAAAMLPGLFSVTARPSPALIIRVSRHIGRALRMTRPSGGRVEALGGFATYPVTVHIKAVGVGRQGWEVDQGQDLRAI